ncbi:MAG: glutathione peroxidase [Ferruginibacter sp.]
MKTILLLALITACSMQSNTDQTAVDTNPVSIHRFEIPALDGGTIKLSDFKGKKILIVNTASACGYTPQYEELEKLYNQFKDQLVVIGFPCNDFGGQEPGTADEIRSFCKKNYGVTFPMAAKVSVKGSSIAPIYNFLTQKSENGVLDARISWNFNKFLIDENGFVLRHYNSGTDPLDESITSLLK